MKIAIADPLSISEHHMDIIKTLGDVSIYLNMPLSEADIVQRIGLADIAIVNWVKISRSVMQSCPKLKFIIASSVGYDSIDVKAATALGIKALNCPTHNFISVAEHTFAIILALIRHLHEAKVNMKMGIWEPNRLKGSELFGKKLGLLGYGRIGRKVAEIAHSFGMIVRHANSNNSSQYIDNLIQESDFVSLHLPLTDATRHVIDSRRLDLMKTSAYLINTSRGNLIDQCALLDSLQNGNIAGAALDVFENEPKNDLVSEQIHRLALLPNTIVTPHISYLTNEMQFRLGEELHENIVSCINGDPRNQVN